MPYNPGQGREIAKSLSQVSIGAGIKALPFEAIITGGLHAIGIVTGTEPIAAIIAAMGGGAIADLAQRAADHWLQRWFNPREVGALSGAIPALLSKSLAQAVAALQATWQQSLAYVGLNYRDPEEAKRTVEALQALSRGASSFLAGSEDLAGLIGDDKWAPVAEKGEAQARQMLVQALSEYLYGYNDSFVEFVEAELPDEWLLRFGEALKEDNPEANSAWRSYQKLWQESIQAGVDQLGKAGAETKETVLWLKEWAQRLESSPIAQRDPTGEAALEAALAPVRRRLDEIKAIAEATLQNTQEIKGGVADVRSGVQDVQRDLQQLGSDVRERPLVTIGPGAQITQVYNEQAYNVRGLPNPYLGMRSFTYSDRGSYAGRSDAIASALHLLTAPGARHSLLFITGASGSGKSSFAQAGLLPALQSYYALRDLRVGWAVFRPSRQPLAALADAITQLGLPAQDVLSAPLGKLGSAEAFNSFIQEATPPGQISVLVVDQFEELFSQSDPAQREALFSILDGLLPFEQSCLYVIATMRSDYLPELFQLRDLYSVAGQGVELRAMTAGELKEAIERPLQVAYPAGDKRWEPALVDKLASDASADAAYLPLLQVTLEEIWAGGSLTLSHYGTLADAIKERAEAVYAYFGPGKQPRTQAEQTTIMLIFLDLVDVSLDDEARRDVRRRRIKSELLAGSLERARLVDELASARLLSISVETVNQGGAEKSVEMVDIIHETLIRNWDRLQSTVAEKRQALQQRVRFEQAVGEWLGNGQSAEYLLTGVRLAEARALERRQDITLRDPNAHELLARSTAKQEAAQRQALEEQKRRADEAAGRARVLRLLLAFAGVLLLLAISAAAYAFVQQGQAQKEANARATAVVDANNQRNTAQQEAAARATAQAGTERQLTVARAQALAANAQSQAARDPELSLLLAMQSISTTVQLGQPAVPQAVGALHTALGQPQPIQILQSPLEGHTATVNRASFSPDGRFVLTAGDDGTAKIWEIGTGRVARTLASGSGRVAAAIWSPDGRFVATGGADGAIRLWSASNAQILQTFQTGANSIASLAYSPDGRSIAVGTGSGIAQIWNTGGAGQLRAFKVDIGPLSSVEYSPDGQLLAIADTDGRAGLWASGTGLQTRALLDDPTVPLNSIAYAADGRFIAIAGFDGKARVIDAATGRQVYMLIISSNGPVTDIVFSPNGQSIAATGGAGTAIWTAANGQVVRLLNQEYIQSSVAFSPDGRYIVTASNNIDALGRSTSNTAMIWDATGDRELPTLSGHTDAIYAAAYSPNQRYVATASQDGTTRIWDANSGQSLSTLKGHSRGVDGVAWSPDGRTVATASQDGTVKIWDSANWQELLTLRGHTDIVRSVEYSPDGRSILTAGDDSTVRVWDATTGQELFKLCCHTAAVYSAVYNSDGSLIVTVSLDGSIKIWDAATGKTLHQFQDTVDANSQGSPGFGSPVLSSATWSKDSRYIAIASSTGKVLVWDVNLEKMVLTLQDTVPTESAAFSPDGNYILTACAGGTAKVWAVKSGQLFLTLTTQAKNLNYAAWSPDGRFIVAAGDSGVAWQYIFDLPGLMKLAASRTFRSLTPGERAIYMGEQQAEALPAPSPESLLTPTPVLTQTQVP